MKLNKDCIKTVLNYVIENVNVIFDDSGIGYNTVDVLTAINNLSQEGKFTRAELLHSFIYASKYSLLQVSRGFDLQDLKLSLIQLIDVTPAGYYFLERQ